MVMHSVSVEDCSVLKRLGQRLTHSSLIESESFEPDLDEILKFLFSARTRALHKHVYVLIERLSEELGLQRCIVKKFSNALDHFLGETATLLSSSALHHELQETFSDLDSLLSPCKPVFDFVLDSKVFSILSCLKHFTLIRAQADAMHCFCSFSSEKSTLLGSFLRVLNSAVQLGRNRLEKTRRENSELFLQEFSPFLCLLQSVSQCRVSVSRQHVHCAAMIYSLLLPPWVAIDAGKFLRVHSNDARVEMSERVHCPTNVTTRDWTDIFIAQSLTAVQCWTQSFTFSSQVALMKGCIALHELTKDSCTYIECIVTCLQNPDLDASMRFTTLQAVELIFKRMVASDTSLLSALTLRDITTALLDLWEESGGASTPTFRNVAFSLCERLDQANVNTPRHFMQTMTKLTVVHRGRFSVLSILGERYGMKRLLEEDSTLLETSISVMSKAKFAHSVGEFLVTSLRGSDEMSRAVLSGLDTATISDTTLLHLTMHLFLPLSANSPDLMKLILLKLSEKPFAYFRFACHLINKRLSVFCLIRQMTGSVLWGEGLVNSDFRVRMDCMNTFVRYFGRERSAISTILQRNIRQDDSSHRNVWIIALKKWSLSSQDLERYLYYELHRQQFPGNSLDSRLTYLHCGLHFTNSIKSSENHISFMFASLLEGWDRVRNDAFHILCEQKLHQCHFDSAVKWAQIEGFNSVVRKRSEAACMILYLADRFMTDSSCTSCRHEERICSLLQDISFDIGKVAKYSKFGVHANLTWIRLLIRYTKRTSFSSDVINNVITASSSVLSACTSLLSNVTETEDLCNPSRDSFIDCRGHVIIDGLTNLEQRHIITNAWLAVKEVCELLDEVYNVSEIITYEASKRALTELSNALLQTKHNGIMFKSRQSLSVLATSLLRHSGCTLVLNLMQDLLGAKGVRSMNESRILRRSQGLPHAIVGLLEAEDASKPRCLLSMAMDVFFEITCEDTEVVQQHVVSALHVVKFILESSILRESTTIYLEKILLIVLRNIDSAEWSVRNSCLMVHGQLVSRIAGDQKAHRSLTYSQFQVRYPGVVSHLLNFLYQCSRDTAFLFLLLFSTLSTCCTQARTTSTNSMLEALFPHLGSPHQLVRMKAAEVMPCLIGSEKERDTIIKRLLSLLKSSNKNNQLHGVLLALTQLHVFVPLYWHTLTLHVDKCRLRRLTRISKRGDMRCHLDQLSIEPKVRHPTTGCSPTVATQALHLLDAILSREESPEGRVFLCDLYLHNLHAIATHATLDHCGTVPADYDAYVVGNLFGGLRELKLLPYATYEQEETEKCILTCLSYVMQSNAPVSREDYSVLWLYFDSLPIRVQLSQCVDCMWCWQCLRAGYTKFPKYLKTDIAKASPLTRAMLRLFKGEEDICVLPYETKSSLLQLAALARATGVTLPGVSPSSCETLCVKWCSDDFPLPLRMSACEALVLLSQEEGKPDGYFNRPACEGFVQLLTDETECVRQAASRAVFTKGSYIAVDQTVPQSDGDNLHAYGVTGVMGFTTAQVEVALEHHFYNMLVSKVWEHQECKLLQKLIPQPSIFAPSVKEDVIFDAEPMNMYREDTQLAQFYASIVRCALSRGTKGRHADLVHFLVLTFKEWGAYLTQNAFHVPYGATFLWAEPWNIVYRLLLLAWSTSAITPMSALLSQLPLDEAQVLQEPHLAVLWNRRENCDVRDALFLLSEHYHSRLRGIE